MARPEEEMAFRDDRIATLKKERDALAAQLAEAERLLRLHSDYGPSDSYEWERNWIKWRDDRDAFLGQRLVYKYSTGLYEYESTSDSAEPR